MLGALSVVPAQDEHKVHLPLREVDDFKRLARRLALSAHDHLGERELTRLEAQGRLYQLRT